MKPYYAKLIAGLRQMGIRVETVLHDRWTTLATVEDTPGIHIVDHGSWRHDRLLNTGIAYVYPFWNLDPWGIRALSSIAAMPFDPDSEDSVAVAEFTARLRKRLVGKRISRYPQPMEKLDLPSDCIAVFLQSEAHRDVEETCCLSMREMLAALLARDDRRAVVIKPHPRDTDPKTRGYLARLAARDARVRVVDANIHDILAKAAVAVTINSAVGIEAHLHRVPVVLCGQTDFHHASVTVKDRGDMDAGLAQAEATVWPHDAYLHWYFVGQCLSAGKPTLVGDFLTKVAATSLNH
jgi:Capsule polysaccharide biosynthesis protein